MSFDLNNKGENQSPVAMPEAPKNKTSKFMTLSMLLHTAVILAMTVLTIPLIEETKTETITVELKETPMPQLQEQVKGVDVLPTQGGAPAISEPLPTVKTAAKSTMVAAAKVAPSPQTNFKATPMTIDDIEAPALDSSELAATPARSDLNEDLSEDFEKVDKSHSEALASEQSKIDAMASAVASEQDEELKSIDNQNKEDAARFATAQQSLRRNNAKAIASAIASEQRARAAAAAAESKGAAGLGQEQNAGAGNNGATTAGTQVAGSPTGVRKLEQLRQMPNNPRPQYEREERRRGDSGQLIYEAYVTKEGSVTNFHMKKSTGFANLDAKTLAALKKWRFYPGQEGWVELPFRWDLKGGVQEDGGRLRTAMSQR